MNHHAHPRHREDSWFVFFSNALVWALFLACGLVLAWFISVLQEINHRGEQRRMQQRTTGSLILADERAGQPSITDAATAVLTASNEATSLR